MVKKILYSALFCVGVAFSFWAKWMVRESERRMADLSGSIFKSEIQAFDIRNLSQNEKDMFAKFDSYVGECNQEFVKDLPISQNTQYVFFSDLHLGAATRSDNFRRNETTLKRALAHYLENDFFLVLLGDVEDLHQFSLHEILKQYGAEYPGVRPLYSYFSEFFNKGKLVRVYGNHDIDFGVFEPISNRFAVQEAKLAFEAVRFGDGNLGFQVIATHGHQYIENYERDVTLVRLGTRIFREIEDIFGSPGRDMGVTRSKHKDSSYSKWAAIRNKILICGHTHNPVFREKTMWDWVNEKLEKLRRRLKRRDIPNSIREILNRQRRFYSRVQADVSYLRSRRQSPSTLFSENYYNTGACIFRDGITCLEMVGYDLKLVRWEKDDSRMLDDGKEDVWAAYNIKHDILRCARKITKKRTSEIKATILASN